MSLKHGGKSFRRRWNWFGFVFPFICEKFKNITQTLNQGWCQRKRMALADGEAEVVGYCVWPLGSFKQHIYSMLIGQLSGLPLPTDNQQMPSRWYLLNVTLRCCKWQFLESGSVTISWLNVLVLVGYTCFGFTTFISQQRKTHKMSKVLSYKSLLNNSFGIWSHAKPKVCQYLNSECNDSKWMPVSSNQDSKRNKIIEKKTWPTILAWNNIISKKVG